MRLRLYFSGMQLFVPLQEPSPRVQVVMPVANGHHGTEQHIPLLVVKMGYLSRGNNEEGAGWFIYPLRGRVLSIDGTGASTRICPEIVDIREVTRLPIDSDVLAFNENGRAAARVDLHAGRMARVEDGACWYWQSASPRPCAHRAEWEVDWADETVSLVLTDWRGGDQIILPALYPLEGTDLVDVSIMHVPEAELPLETREIHVPSAMTEAPHFGRYFSVLNGLGPEGRPRFAGKPGSCGSLLGACAKIPQAGASPYNCMLATISRPMGG